jgi:hypothetical protein
MINLMLRSVAAGLLFVGVFGYAIKTQNNWASPWLIIAGLVLFILGRERNGAN